MSGDTSDPLASLLAPELAEPFAFALLLAYASGWNDALRDTPLAIDDARLSARIEAAGEQWHKRLVKQWNLPSVPTWLAQLQERHEPPPWEDAAS